MHVARHVRWVRLDDLVILLDTRRGEYVGLDPQDSRRWCRLVGESTEWYCGTTSPDGFGRLAATARARGWLAGEVSPAGARPVRAAADRPTMPLPPVLGAYLRLLGAVVRLTVGGFRRGYAWAEAASVSSAPRQPLALGPAVDAFLRAEQGYFSRRAPRDCLPRTLALFVHLCRSGLPVRHVIGVARYPFRAHAWVEHGSETDSEVVLDSVRRTGGYTPIATISRG